MSNGNETLTLDKAFEYAYQIEHALEAVSDAKYAEALGRIREMLERAVEFRDQMISLEQSRTETRKHYELLVQQSESLKRDIDGLEKRKAELQEAVNEKAQALRDLRAEATKIAVKIANE